MRAIVLGNTFRRRLGVVAGAMVALLAGTPALAQGVQPTLEPPAPEGARQLPAEAPPVPDAPPPPELPPPAPPPPATEAAELKALLEAQQKRIDALEARLDDAQSPDEEVVEDKLKIYGFTDFGLQRIFSSDSFAAFSETETSFVLGNLNVYFDAQPIERWRTLFEIRFTNAPNGNLVTTPTGATTRTSTFQFDPHAGVWDAPMWGGYTVIERAHTDYLASQYFNVRVGNFFSPIGIWNVDHGSPVLIPVTPPQIILQRFYPLRQTGLQFYGSAFAGPWELGYVLTLTNGRQELSNFDFDDDKALGGRLFARNEGEVRTQIGVSAYAGNAEDKAVTFSAAGVPIASSTWEYDEYVVGADFSLDAGGTRIRTEAVMQRQIYEPGKRENALFSFGGKSADGYRLSAYLVAAQQLPILGLEPYLMLEGLRGPNNVADTVGVVSGGLNIHFSPVTQLKMQGVRVLFWNMRDDPRSENGIPPTEFNHTILTSRLVVAF
jgi:hypothetical protein